MDEQETTFTEIDSVTSLVQELRSAGYAASVQYGGVVTDMSDEQFQAFMRTRGYVLEGEIRETR